jgi:pentatricopeptide repeat protein
MQQKGTNLDKFTFVQAIKACVGLEELEDGWLVHQQLMQSGCEFHIFLGTSLVGMYAKCGSIEEGWRLFKKMPS